MVPLWTQMRARLATTLPACPVSSMRSEADPLVGQPVLWRTGSLRLLIAAEQQSMERLWEVSALLLLSGSNGHLIGHRLPGTFLPLQIFGESKSFPSL